MPKTERVDIEGSNETPAKGRGLIKPVLDENGRIVITPEMREVADKLAHPEGDPYENGRQLGFYCETCG